VTNIAQHGLRILHQQSLNIIHQLLTQFRICINHPSQVLGRDAKCLARNLHNTSIWRTHCAEHDGYSHDPEAADHGDCDGAVAGRTGEQGGNALLNEMNVFERPIAFLNNLPSP
jgi:hypothetical protein